MRTKSVFAFAALALAPLAFAGGEAYPNERVAAFVVEKLDATSLPDAMRPKKEKGKKTLADYGYKAQKIEENEAIVAAPGGARALWFTVLEGGPSGIYVCAAEMGQNGGTAKTQTVMLLRWKDGNALLRGRESFREFDSCPVIGESDSTTSAYGGD